MDLHCPYKSVDAEAEYCNFVAFKVDSLPQSFIVKYVGSRPAGGLWGIQHTRAPVDSLVDDLRAQLRSQQDSSNDQHHYSRPLDDLPLIEVLPSTCVNDSVGIV